MNNSISKQLYAEALQCFPGGVSSPVRAFKSVGGTPIFMERGAGSHIWDVDGNEYIDFCCSWGPLILGHTHPAVVAKVTEALHKGTSFGTPTPYELALGKLILANNRFIEKIRFVSSGTEAVMSAIRLARGYTNRDKVVKFDGCYHGHVDSMLVKAGSGLVTFGISSSSGVPQSLAQETLVLPLNDVAALEQAFADNPNEIAAVIIEPIPANNGLLLQNRDYLVAMRQLCTQNGAMLIFDEVISGFRIGFEGAAGYYDIEPDIITYGKIIGGGMPVGAYGANKTIMSHISPDGPVYQAGTLSGNPVAMAAGIAQLSECLTPNFYENLAAKTQHLVDSINSFCTERNYLCYLTNIGSIFWIVFSHDHAIRTADQIDADSMKYFKALYHELLNKGIYLGPSGYEVGFISSAHTDADIQHTITAMKEVLMVVFEK